MLLASNCSTPRRLSGDTAREKWCSRAPSSRAASRIAAAAAALPPLSLLLLALPLPLPPTAAATTARVSSAAPSCTRASACPNSAKSAGPALPNSVNRARLALAPVERDPGGATAAARASTTAAAASAEGGVRARAADEEEEEEEEEALSPPPPPLMTVGEPRRTLTSAAARPGAPRQIALAEAAAAPSSPPPEEEVPSPPLPPCLHGASQGLRPADAAFGAHSLTSSLAASAAACGAPQSRHAKMRGAAGVIASSAAADDAE